MPSASDRLIRAGVAARVLEAWNLQVQYNFEVSDCVFSAMQDKNGMCVKIAHKKQDYTAYIYVRRAPKTMYGLPGLTAAQFAVVESVLVEDDLPI